MLLTGGGGIYFYSRHLDNAQETAAEKDVTETASGTETGITTPVLAEKIEKAQEKDTGEDTEEKQDVGYENTTETYAAGRKWYETAEDGKSVLAFAGDILFDDEYSIMANMKRRTNGIYDTISADLLAEMTEADILMLNNEFTYTNRGEPTPEKQFTFRAEPETADILLEMGVDIVSLANNHAYDYGEISLLDSLDTLAAREIPYVGAGRDIAEASRPFFFETKDTKIGIIAATQIERLDNPDTKEAAENSAGVFRCWDGTELYRVTQEASQQCDFLVVFVHWGSENTTEIDWAQKDQARQLVQAGADLIIGNHSHCLQEIEVIEGVPVFYSLGNFLFNSKTLDTCLVKAEVSEGKLSGLQFIPAIQKDCRTELLTGSEKQRVITYMQSLSTGITIDADGYISY